MALATEVKRKAAVEIVLEEERAKGWEPALAGSWSKEKEYGCDILSTPPGGGEPDRVEVKGWGEPIFKGGQFRYGQDIRVSQYNAAMTNPRFRIEIVANLDAYLRGTEGYDRLTVDADYIRAHAVPRGYDVPLHDLRDHVKHVEKR